MPFTAILPKGPASKKAGGSHDNGPAIEGVGSAAGGSAGGGSAGAAEAGAAGAGAGGADAEALLA